MRFRITNESVGGVIELPEGVVRIDPPVVEPPIPPECPECPECPDCPELPDCPDCPEPASPVWLTIEGDTAQIDANSLYETEGVSYIHLRYSDGNRDG